MKKIMLILLVLTISITNAQVINFPDPAFKSLLLQADTDNDIGGLVKIDANSDGEITQSEALAVYQMVIPPESINDLTGIEYFTNIMDFQCTYNHLTSVDFLYFFPQLMYLNLTGNQLTSLNLSGFSNLFSLTVDSNQLTNLVLTGLPQLKYLRCGENQLEQIDFSNLSALKAAICSQNLVTVLDFSNNPLFDDLGCQNNPNLTTLKINNNRKHFATPVIFNGCWDNNPNLTTICADAFEVSVLQSFLDGCSITQPINIVTDCSLGINEKEKNNIVVYPNPSTDGRFTLVFDEKINEGTIEVYNLLGQKVAQDTTQNATEHQLNMPIAAGTYILRFNNGSEQIIKRVIIK